MGQNLRVTPEIFPQSYFFRSIHEYTISLYNYCMILQRQGTDTCTLAGNLFISISQGGYAQAFLLNAHSLPSGESGSITLGDIFEILERARIPRNQCFCNCGNCGRIDAVVEGRDQGTRNSEGGVSSTHR